MGYIYKSTAWGGRIISNKSKWIIFLKAFSHCLCLPITALEYGFSKITTGNAFFHHCACFKGWKCTCVGWVTQWNVNQCINCINLTECISPVLPSCMSMASFSSRWRIHITLLRQKAGLLTCYSSHSAEHPYFWHFYSYTETHHPSAPSKSYHLDFTIYSRRLTGILYEILPKLPLFLLQI